MNNLSSSRRALDRLLRDPMAVVCLLIVAMFVAVMICADWIVPYEQALKLDGIARLSKPSPEHIFGCDSMGRDLFARMVHGTRTSVSMGVGVTAFVVAVATVLGALCAYYGGWLDMVVMRLCDLLSCIPGILLSLALVAALGPGRDNLLIAISVSGIPGATRQFRALMLNVTGNDYITAARAAGARDSHIIFRHVLPNVLPYVVLTATSTIAGMIMQISGLSYIGMGIQHPEPEWGAMLSEARGLLLQAPHLLIVPGTAILVLSLSLNLLGDSLRDALDPRLSRE